MPPNLNSSQDEALYGLVDGLAPADADLRGAPAPLPCRVRVVWLDDADSIAAARTLGSPGTSLHPQEAELRHRDLDGMYSSALPYWSEVSQASRMTHRLSERKVTD